MKKCCVALMLLIAQAGLAAELDTAKFIDFTGTTIDGRVARPAAIYVEGHQRARFDRLLSLKKSMRDALAASVRDPTLR